MSIGALALVLALASFAVLSAAALVLRRTIRVSPEPAVKEAQALFRWAVAPTVVPALIAGAVLLPSFLMHEAPRQDEWPGVLLVVLAAAGATRLLIIAVRTLFVLRASRALVRTWLRGATPLPDTPWGIRASRIDVGYPVVAVAGLFKPHVFVDRRVLETCSRAELEAVAAHERAHVAFRDNLRRLIIIACNGYSSRIDEAWRAAAERAADDRAARSARSATDLAGALVRIARLAPSRMLPIAAISTIHDCANLEGRVQRLLAYAPVEQQLVRVWPTALTIFAAVLGLMIASPLPKTLHGGLELFVRHLP